jgi:hypothetical protein
VAARAQLLSRIGRMTARPTTSVRRGGPP